MASGFLWIMLFFLPYGALHSWMASLSFKAFLENRWPQAYRRFYRLFYNFFSVVTFLPLLYLQTILPNAGIYQTPPPWGHIMFGGQLAAVVLFLIAFFQTDFLAFIGLRQVFQSTHPDEEQRLFTGGFYHLVRHPLYLFVILILWLTPNMSWNTLGFNIGASLYLIIGMYFEERKLQREFGEQYKRYKETVPALIPFIKPNKS